MRNNFRQIKPLEINQFLSLMKRYIFLAKRKFSHMVTHPINSKIKKPMIMSEVTKTRNNSIALPNRVKKLSPGEAAYMKNIVNAKIKLRKCMSLLMKIVFLFIFGFKFFIRNPFFILILSQNKKKGNRK